MHRGIGIVPLLLVVLFPTAGQGQNQHRNEMVIVGGVLLEGGMSEQEVSLSIKKAGYEFDRLKSGGESWNQWIVYKKGADLAGVVAFRDGKLVNVRKGWGHFSEPETVNFANALLAAIANFVGSDAKLAFVETRTLRSPDVITQTVELRFDKTTISFMILESGAFDSLWEAAEPC